MKFMKQKKIQCREFYPSMSHSKFTKSVNKLNLNDSLFSRNGIFLPSGPHQKINDIKKVIKHINTFIKNNF